MNEKIEFNIGETFVGEIPFIQKQEIKCHTCGRPNYFAILPEYASYKKAYEALSNEHRRLLSELNELIEFSEINYGINPSKDKLINLLSKLRDKFCKD